MEVQEVLVNKNQQRYILLDEKGNPVLPVLKFLKYLDNTAKSPNTIRTYCYALKSYFEYLDNINKSFLEVGIQELSNFIGWLRNPYKDEDVTPMFKTESGNTESTINLKVTVVTTFYDYLNRIDSYDSDLIKKLFNDSYSGKQKYKGFLDHLNNKKTTKRNILKLKEPKKNYIPLSKEEVEKVYNACNNIRDKFLIKLLYESGIRIGEALGLFKEDIICDHVNGHKVIIKRREHIENNARLKTLERKINISYDVIKLYDEYIFDILSKENVDNNYLFVKITGENKGKALEYQNINSLFKRISKKTNLHIYPHRLRHTHATEYYRETKNIKALQERLGHSDIQTTLKMYVHLSLDDLREDWEKYNSSLKPLLNKNEDEIND